MEWKKVIAGERDGTCYSCGFLFESAFQVGAVGEDEEHRPCQLCVECAESELNGEHTSKTFCGFRERAEIQAQENIPSNEDSMQLNEDIGEN